MRGNAHIHSAHRARLVGAFAAKRLPLFHRGSCRAASRVVPSLSRFSPVCREDSTANLHTFPSQKGISISCGSRYVFQASRLPAAPHSILRNALLLPVAFNFGRMPSDSLSLARLRFLSLARSFSRFVGLSHSLRCTARCGWFRVCWCARATSPRCSGGVVRVGRCAPLLITV